MSNPVPVHPVTYLALFFGFTAFVSSYLLTFYPTLNWKDVPTSRVAPEVCARQGAVKKVQLYQDEYHVTCASGIIVLTRP